MHMILLFFYFFCFFFTFFIFIFFHIALWPTQLGGVRNAATNTKQMPACLSTATPGCGRLEGGVWSIYYTTWFSREGQTYGSTAPVRPLL